MNKFDFTTWRLVFVRFLEESEDTKKTFRNQLTFNNYLILYANGGYDYMLPKIDQKTDQKIRQKHRVEMFT